MISKAEYFYAKKKKDDLTLRIVAYEATSKVYAMWKIWIKMSVTEKNKLISDWEEYYKKCFESYYGKKFWEARKHYANWLRSGDGAEKERLNAIVDEVKKSTMSFIKTPSTVDPRELERKLHGYVELKKKQQEYQEMFDEYEEAYEPKKSKAEQSL